MISKEDSEEEIDSTPTKRKSSSSANEDEPKAPQCVEKTSPKKDTTRRAEKSKSVCSWIVVVIVVAVLAFVVHRVDVKGSPVGNYDYSKRVDEKIVTYINVWKAGYPNQNDQTWYTIAGQMLEFADIGNVSPLVLVFAYERAQKTANLLASEISSSALQLKNGVDKCGDMDITKVSGSDSRIQGGCLLNERLSQIEKCKKMIIHNLEELDGRAAKDLHSLIDPDHPNVPNAVFIFTVKIHGDFEKNAYQLVQSTLKDRWGIKMEADKLNPLLSRLVNNIKVVPEPTFDL